MVRIVTQKEKRKQYIFIKNSITDYAEKMFQQATLENYGQAEMPEWEENIQKHS